jgi:plasmid stabilization system protein ParE
MRIIWSKIAERDLYIGIGYIAQDSREQALKVLSEVIALSKSLSQFPYKYPKEPLYNDESVRYTVIYSYKMVYKIYENKIRILRLFHTKQNPKKI